MQDGTLKSELNSKAGTLPTSSNNYEWTNSGYYLNNSNATSYMWFIDIDQNNDGAYDYRGVYFTSYRPKYSNESSEGYQSENGYTTGETYWFKYEPIRWRILSEENGKALILCETLIDSQGYNSSTSSKSVSGKTVYANNYEQSSIRTWLNNNFYNTAFSSLQKQLIQLTAVDNGLSSTGSVINDYVCANTQDNVFLLSYEESVKADMGFDGNANGKDSLRQKQTTDYAKCQGIYSYSSGQYADNGYWWLRSPYSELNNYALITSFDGRANFNNYVNYVGCGVCPALFIQLA